MKRLKLWYCDKMIALCNIALKYRDGAEGIHDVNEVIEIRNYFMRERPTNEG